MASLGHMEEFDPADPSSWDSYADRLEFFLEANKVVDADQKRAVLLSVIGSKTFDIVRSLISPAKPKDRSCEEILALLKNHFAPTPSETVRRFHFNRRNQQPGESIAAYITELRKRSENCNFGASLESLLRDRLVCGVQDEALQRRLLAKQNLTFTTAQEEARAYEAAHIHSKEIQSSSCKDNSPDINVVTKSDVKSKDFLPQTADTAPFKGTCYSCGGRHKRNTCRFRNAVCHVCKRTGHIQTVCQNKAIGTQNQYHNVNTKPTAAHSVQSPRVVLDGDIPAGVYSNDFVNNVGNSSSGLKVYTEVLLQGVPCKMEVDTGCAYSLISEETFTLLWPQDGPSVVPCDVHLVDYNKQVVEITGACFIVVKYGEYTGHLRLIITKGQRASLLGREWFAPLGISLTGVHNVSTDALQKVIADFSAVFEEGLGTYKGPPVSFLLDSTVPPIRMKPRKIALALRPKVDDEITRLVEQGVLEPITHPKWCTPIVPVLKPSGDVRICADYKCTINKALQEHPFQIPAVNQVLTTLARGRVFAKLDMAQAYQQLPVDDEAADAQTLITHKGAFRARRLQFGVSIAPGIFQNLMEDLLSGLPGVVPYFDDVLIGADCIQSLASQLRLVLTRFRDAGLKLKKEKCVFGVSSVDFLGYKIDTHGIHPSDSKVEAIHRAPNPTSKQELQAFLGLLNFYHAFLPDKATIAEPLHRLLDKDAPWEWTDVHATAFHAAKQLLSSDSVLIHYDLEKPLTLTCDASPYGIGAVLSHVLTNGVEAPIAFYSRTMSTTERNYAQIDKEALAIVSGVKKFHDYLYGRRFTIITDHKPLLGLFTSTSPTPQIISPRMLRWSLMLNAYDCEFKYRPGKDIAHADGLSRLPLPSPDFLVPPVCEVLMLESIPHPPLHAGDIACMTAKDPLLARVLNWVWRGWPKSKVEEKFKPFVVRQHELSAYKGCLLWGNRVIIPHAGQDTVLHALHEGHPGIVRMKALARSYVWWPKMDDVIEKWVKNCVPCQSTRHAPSKATVHPWEVTKSPWSRLHVDFAGPFQGQMFFLVVDSFSKWLEVISVPSATSATVVRVLRSLFATHGLPDTIVSDNGTQFTSSEFKAFMASNLIRHVTIAPFHPSSNGQAERMVQTTKDSLKRIVEGDWNHRLASFLLQQHVTPCSSTGCSPAELLMNRRLKICLDRLHPDLTSELQEKQESKFNKDSNASSVRVFTPDSAVYIRSYVSGPKWIPAKVLVATGPLSYKVQLPDGRILRRHIDQIRERRNEVVPVVSSSCTGLSGMPVDGDPLDDTVALSPGVIVADPGSLSPSERALEEEIGPTDSPAKEVPNLACGRPTRNIRLPSYLKDFQI